MASLSAVAITRKNNTSGSLEADDIEKSRTAFYCLGTLMFALTILRYLKVFIKAALASLLRLISDLEQLRLACFKSDKTCVINSSTTRSTGTLRTHYPQVPVCTLGSFDFI